MAAQDHLVALEDEGELIPIEKLGFRSPTMREAARPKYERWNQPFSDVVLNAEPVIPTSALIQY